MTNQWLTVEQDAHAPRGGMRNKLTSPHVSNNKLVITIGATPTGAEWRDLLFYPPTTALFGKMEVFGKMEARSCTSTRGLCSPLAAWVPRHREGTVLMKLILNDA